MIAEPAPAKINLALHVRAKRPDGRHEIETLFAFCVDGDRVAASDAPALSLDISGPFAGALAREGDNLVIVAARRLADAAGIEPCAALHLTKNLPVASGIGGGSADAAAALRLLTRLWAIDPGHAATVAPGLGADVPACLLSMTARGTGLGDALALVDAGVAGRPVLLVNPLRALSTAKVFEGWDADDRGPLGEWQEGRNDLTASAIRVVPEIGAVLAWLGERRGAGVVRMSGSGATCFALFDDEARLQDAAQSCPPNWWHMGSVLR